MGNYTLGTTVISELFTNVEVLNASWVISAMVIILTLLLITRDPNKWMKLALPVSLTWMMCGLPGTGIFITASAILYAINLGVTDLIGEKWTARSEIRTAIKMAQGRRLTETAERATKTLPFGMNKLTSLISKGIGKQQTSILTPPTMKQMDAVLKREREKASKGKFGKIVKLNHKIKQPTHAEVAREQSHIKAVRARTKELKRRADIQKQRGFIKELTKLGRTMGRINLKEQLNKRLEKEAKKGSRYTGGSGFSKRFYDEAIRIKRNEVERLKESLKETRKKIKKIKGK